jgi:hypothetical protein
MRPQVAIVVFVASIIGFCLSLLVFAFDFQALTAALAYLSILLIAVGIGTRHPAILGGSVLNAASVIIFMIIGHEFFGYMAVTGNVFMVIGSAFILTRSLENRGADKAPSVTE